VHDGTFDAWPVREVVLRELLHLDPPASSVCQQRRGDQGVSLRFGGVNAA
jgi:hypothetical protein